MNMDLFNKKANKNSSQENNCTQRIENSNAVDILLIQCPPWDVGMPPLGVAYLSGYLKKFHYKTCVCDLNIDLYNLAKKDEKFLWEQKSYDYWVNDSLFLKTWSQLEKQTSICLSEALKKINSPYIGLSVNFAGIHFAREVIKIIKQIKKETGVIVGGWGCVNEHMRSLFPKELVDVFIVGEGEETLKETMEALQDKREIDGIKGAIFNKAKNVQFKPRLPIMDLDTIPWPTFSKMDLNRYKDKSMPLFTSRGCIGTCSFCNDWPLSRPYRARSAEQVFEEIRYHVENNNINRLSFKDLSCNGSIDRLNSLSDLIINSGLRIHWDSQAIPRKEMTYELLCKLRKTGCETLIYGVESFSNNVLKGMRKIFTKETAEAVLKDTYNAGIHAMINIIVGFPGEKEEDFQETLEAIRRNRKYISQVGAISVCLVNNDSDLDINFKDYNINLPLDPAIRAKEWNTLDGSNDYELRKSRAEILLEQVNQLGLCFATKTT